MRFRCPQSRGCNTITTASTSTAAQRKDDDYHRHSESSSSSDEDFRPLRRLKPLRLRGGVETPFGSPRTDNDKTFELPTQESAPSTSTMMSDQALPPHLLTLRDSDVETDPEVRSGLKRKKTADELSAFNDEYPDLSQSDSLGLTQASKRCGTKFTTILLQEKEKKKISVAAFKDLTDCKNTYDEIIDRLIMENLVLSGRLSEARTNHEVAQVYNRSIIAKLVDAKLENLTKPAEEGPERIETEQPNLSLDDELQTATESDAPKTRYPRRKKKNTKKGYHHPDAS